MKKFFTSTFPNFMAHETLYICFPWYNTHLGFVPNTSLWTFSIYFLLIPPYFVAQIIPTVPQTRQWHPTPVLLSGKSHARRSLVGCNPWVAKSRTRLNNFTLTFHFHALEKEMATHSSVLAWRIPGTGEPGGPPSLGSHRVRHGWSDLAAAAAPSFILFWIYLLFFVYRP